MSFRSYIPNPKGLGGLQFNPHLRLIVGGPNSPKCGAVTRRTGLPCRNLPVGLKPGGRCDKHGGKSTQSGVRVLAENDRRQHSKAVALARAAARRLLEQTTLNPDTMKTVAPYLGTIYEPDADRVILACNDWMNGGSRAEFKAVLEMARQHVGPRNPNPKRWKRKTPIVAASKSMSALAAPTSPSKSIEPQSVIEAQLIDRRIAARPASSRELIETIELWRSPKDRDPKGW